MNRSLMKQCLDALEAANRAISAEHVALITEDAIEALRAELTKSEPQECKAKRVAHEDHASW